MPTKVKKNKKMPQGQRPKGTKTVNVPAAKSATRSTQIAADHVVAGRELMASVSGNSAAFLLLGSSGVFPGYDLNPGNRTMFPWLSLVASAYEKYRFETLEFEVVPRNPTSSAGAVYAALDYDWDDNPATTANELMSNRGAISSDVWSPSKFAVDIRRLNEDVPWRYVADFPRSDSSQRMVYGGFFMIGIAGTAAAVSFDIFVNYRVKFSLPALHSLDSSSSMTFPLIKTLSAAVMGFFDTLPSVTGINTVIAGQSGAPIMGGYSNMPAYKIGTASKGTLSLVANPATAASPPSTYVADTVFGGQVYDAVGTALAQIDSTPGLVSASQFPQGPETGATWATNGALGRASYSISLAVLRKMLPQAVYLVPYLFSTAGRVLSTASKLSSRYTEL